MVTKLLYDLLGNPNMMVVMVTLLQHLVTLVTHKVGYSIIYSIFFPPFHLDLPYSMIFTF